MSPFQDLAATAFSRSQDATGSSLTSDEAAHNLHQHMEGKVVIITGVTPGSLGAEAARVIAAHAPSLLILAGRSEEVIGQTIAAIQPTTSPNTRIESVVLDLGSQASVRSAASRVLELTPTVNVLINNAAIMMPASGYGTTPEGIELQFGVNHIGHFLFTNLLMSALLQDGAHGRVVTVTSLAHQVSGVRLDDVNFGHGKSYDGFTAYGQSKSANLLFTLSLVTRFGDKGLQAFSVDPGSAPTNLPKRLSKEDMIKHGWMHENGELNEQYKSIIGTAQKSVGTYIVAAYDPSLTDQNGSTLAEGVIDQSLVADHAKDSDVAEKLWHLSEKLVGQVFQG